MRFANTLVIGGTLGLAVSLAACKKKETAPSPEGDGPAATAPKEAGVPANTKPRPPAAAKPAATETADTTSGSEAGDIPAPTDFEDEFEKAVTESNYKEALKEFEKKMAEE